jgi:hypothetical protein
MGNWSAGKQAETCGDDEKIRFVLACETEMKRASVAVATD